MPPPNRRPSRKPVDPAEDSMPVPQDDSTRIKSVSAVRRPARQEQEEPEAPEEESSPAEEDYGGEEGYYGEDAPAQEDDDDNPDATRAGPPLKLEIIEGPDKGRRKRFKGVRMVIGRGQDCELVLLDQSVSRRHVELVFGGENGVLLRDLVSGNGTRVNDTRVDDCKLKHDDVISIGRTKIRFIDEQERIKQMRLAAEEAERKEKEEAERKAREAEEAAKKAAEAPAAGSDAGASSEGGAPAPDAEKDKQTQIRSIHDIPRRDKPKRNPMGMLMAGGVVVLLALIGGGVLFLNREPPPPPPPNPKQEKALELLQQARTAFRMAEYAQAVALAEEADTTFPGLDSQGILPAARKELALVEAFAQVRQLASENKFDEARELLAQTPHSTVERTEELREKLDAELSSSEIAYLVKQVDAALEAEDVESARAFVQRLPLELQPPYQAKVAELQALLDELAKDAASQERARRAAAARRAKEQREAFITQAFSMVETRFNAGDYSRAALECDRVIEAHSDDKEIRDRAKLLKKLIPQFARIYLDAQRKVQANALESAARPLRSAAELYRQMGFKGPVGETLNAHLASSAVVAGKSALARNDVATAATFFKEAQRLNPEDPKVHDGLAAVQSKLGDLFKQAYVQRDRDPEGSAEKFRLIIQLAAEDSELKSRAEIQLQALAE
ncbi:FHA domain-containing protein [Archangium minus]|uniref:FHA domain-containing protein n=1 Tax=Archangium minus TaxID=83450 RepID=A0ABY9WRF5_9BACT|nr:FHA domain-containing protein [Archangium minus]